MTDILDTLRSYPDDASIMMSKRVVADVIDEIARLRVERDALRKKLAEAGEVVAEAVQWLRVSDLPCEMTIFRADAVLEASSSANGDDSDA